MSEDIFAKFDSEFDTKQLQADEKKAAENGGTGHFEDVPHGKYEVAIDKLELGQSKKGDPMLTVWFKVRAGKYKNQRIFMNQVVTQGFQIHIANEFLRSLDSDEKVTFETYSQYHELILDIFEDISENLEYELDYGENKKGYNTFKITDIFELD